MAVRSARVLVSVLATGALFSCAQASGAPAEAPEYASTSAAAGQFVTPVTCPTPNPVADVNQRICTDEAMTSNVIPGYFLASGDTRKQTEVAQTFQVGRIGAPGRLRTKLSRLFDPPTGTAPKLTVEFRTLIGGAIDITDGTTTTFAYGYVPYDALPLGADISTEYTVNMTSGAAGVGYQMQPGTTYAMVFRVPSPSVLSIGIGGHEDAAQYGNGAGYLRQARLVSANTFSTPPFVADKRDVNFALGLDDGCISGKILTCGVGECSNATPQCGVDPKTGLGQVGQFNTCMPYAPTVELCDLKDNDCDGRTDEIADTASDLAKAPSFPPLGTTTCGIGACVRTYDNCTAGVPLASCVVGTKAVESCNSVDDDCDGRVDEIDDAPGDVSSATTAPAYPPIGYNTCGVGQCQRKTPKCSAGLPQTCLPNSAASTTETCNGLDDNCDGFVDNVDSTGAKLLQSSYSGAAITRSVQQCKDAVQTCSATVVSCTPPASMPFGATTWLASSSCVANAAAWTTTTPEVLPGTETCNGYDENCDGVFDATGGTLVAVDTRCSDSANYGAGSVINSGMFAMQYVPAATITFNRLESFVGVVPTFSPTTLGNSTIQIWSHNASTNKPNALIATSAAFVPRPTPAWQGAPLASPVTLTAGTTYWVVLQGMTNLQRPLDNVACNTVNTSESNDNGVTWSVAGWPSNYRYRFLNATASKIIQSCWNGWSLASPPPGFPQARPNTGICRDGTQPCASTLQQGSSTWGACTGFVAPSSEACNSLDDDCNGTVDEGLGSGLCGVGRCVKQFANCCPQSGVQADGTLCSPGTTQVCPSGVGTKGQGTISGSGGTFGGAFPGNPDFQQFEACNGVDDDCNGNVDQVRGTCSGGTNTGGGCSSAADCPGGTCNLGSTFSTLTQACYTGPAGTVNVGRCRYGTQPCTAPAVTVTAGSPPAYPGTSVWGTCSGDIKPTGETCNSIDDDCDGATDELSDLGTYTCGAGRCLRLADNCVGGVSQNCPSTTKLVQTCSTATPGATLASGATAVTGSCAAPGGTGTGTIQGNVGNAMAERCNGVDDDCDGTVDMDPNNTANKLARACYSGPAGTVNVGRCRYGTQTCNAANVAITANSPPAYPGSESWASCVNDVLPTGETCNSIDDDCDGSTDEVADLGTYTCGSGRCLRNAPNCSGGALQSCPSATGAYGQGTITGTTANQQPEVCNGVDDDCNGTVDKDLAGATLSQTCYTGPAGTLNVGRCRAGTQSCNSTPATVTANSPPAYPGSGAWTTCTDIVPGGETCNNIDDNCDGVVDNPSTSICPLTANVTGTNCVAAACQITSCAAGWFNTDGNYANGCETNDDTSVTGGVCPGSPTSLGTLSLNGTNSWTGLIPISSNSDWFVFNVAPTNGSEGHSKAGTVTVTLSTNPSSDFRVQILNNCSTNHGACATGLTTYQFNDTCTGASALTQDCRAANGNVSTDPSTASATSTRSNTFPTTLIVRVFRAATAAGTAAQYTLNVRYQ